MNTQMRAATSWARTSGNRNGAKARQSAIASATA
jgi:predicted AAA+ superfamily ATPase